jgi:basic membrane protein A
VAESEACFEAMKDLIENDNCSIIIAPSFGYAQYVKEIALLYPDICFILPMGTEFLPNMTTCSGRMYQARYLSGIAAGMRTDTSEIGYVAAYEIPEVIGQINAFALGVKSVAADAVVHVIYCDSWVDDDEARKASEELLTMYPRIDMLTMHTNSLMPNLVAKDKGIWSIGFNMDNAGLFEGSWLTACVWNWDDYYRQKITSRLQGKFYGRHEWVDMENGIVELSELTGECAPGTKEKVAEAAGRFDDRSFDVFYGPVIDNTGELKVPEGESMSDEMLNCIDWYVEGVIVEE